MIDAISALTGGISPNLFGMNVTISSLIRPIPKIQLSCEFDCSDKFRENMNAWLLDMFGTKEVAYRMGDDTLVMSFDVLDRLKQAFNERLRNGR